MLGIDFLLVSVLVAFAQGTNSSQFSNWQSSWIAQGYSVSSDEFPFMVSLRNAGDNRNFCGGTILTNWYVLTAAHCIDGKTKSSIKVVAGTIHPAHPGQSYDVAVTITHQLYNAPEHRHDIGLIKVMAPIVFSPRVKAVTLAADATSVATPGVRCTFPGYGYNNPRRPTFFNHLRKLKLSILHNSQCQAYFGHLSDAYFCATTNKVESKITKGDDGGPLVCSKHQVGVYSRVAEGPGVTVDRSLFINVARYINWIRAVTSIPL